MAKKQEVKPQENLEYNNESQSMQFLKKKSIK